MINITDEIRYAYETINKMFVPSKARIYTCIANFLKQDAEFIKSTEPFYEDTIHFYANRSADDLHKAVKSIDNEERTDKNFIMLPGLRIHRYNRILNFLDHEAGKDPSDSSLVSKAASELFLATKYLKVAGSEIKYLIV